MFTLPVGGRRVALRPYRGAEELVLLEVGGGDTARALALVGALAVPADQDEAPWSGLPATDLDALLIQLRRRVIGDRVVGDVACPAAGCGRRVDLGFGLGDYLAQLVPEPPDEAVPDPAPGWFRLPDHRVRFRPPTAADQLAAEAASDPEADLMRRCVDHADGRDGPVPALMARVEAELERLAPSPARTLAGRCPECGSDVSAFFDPRRYCLRELSDLAMPLYADVDLLARIYGWSEADILGLPQARRAIYAELAHRARKEGR